MCCEVSSEIQQQNSSDIHFSDVENQRRIVPDNSSITSVIRFKLSLKIIYSIIEKQNYHI